MCIMDITNTRSWMIWMNHYDAYNLYGLLVKQPPSTAGYIYSKQAGGEWLIDMGSIIRMIYDPASSITG